MYIGDYLARRCVYSAQKIALVDATQTPLQRYSFAEMNRRANKLGNWLLRHDIGKGDRVAMLAYDGLHFYDVFFACSKVGAIFVPYNWRLHPKEIEDQVRLTSPKILFYSDEEPMTDTIDQFRGRSHKLQLIPIAGKNAPNVQEKLASESDLPVTCESLTENDTACLLFTGGTTGRPKAAQISHKHVVWNTFNANLADVLGSDIFLNVFPMFHTGGLFAFSVPLLLLGGTVVQTKRFDPEFLLQLIEKERVTIFSGVPSVFQLLTETPNWNQADLGSLRYCLSGGAPMPVPLIKKYGSEKRVVFRQGFGMTEYGPDAFSLASEDAERKAGSIGKPNFFVDARVVDIETNTPLPSGKTGELVLRGPAATTGYFQNDAASEKAFDDENYFHTGDLAYVDEEGYFFIVDRLKDMYISGGENVYPAEIESILYKHPAIVSCAVIGVDDPQWGQSGCAFVVLKKHSQTNADEILQFLKNHLTKYKIPKSVIFKDSLPLSGSGKILKNELRNSYEAPG